MRMPPARRPRAPTRQEPTIPSARANATWIGLAVRRGGLADLAPFEPEAGTP